MCSQVRGAVSLYAAAAKTELLLEIDEMWLPVLVALGQRELAHHHNFPEWLHILLPLNTAALTFDEG